MIGKTLSAIVAATVVAVSACGSECGAKPLPKPAKSGGIGVQEALAGRRSVRKFKQTPLSAQQLSDLLWCANGVSSDEGKRTAPSAMNRKDIMVYCLLPEGAFLYQPDANELKPVASGDLRKLATPRHDEPCCLLLVADFSKQGNRTYSYVDVGYVSQNIYLGCQSMGLATCAMGSVGDRDKLGKLLNVSPDSILLAHPVGEQDK
ncbi:MAG: SagB/ThcOx family dehydrogenase [Victivallaceae bacterium]|nr:SagB/ThcOx family dehydrogenase [Victivallaceae bacterium]